MTLSAQSHESDTCRGITIDSAIPTSTRSLMLVDSSAMVMVMVMAMAMAMRLIIVV